MLVVDELWLNLCALLAVTGTATLWIRLVGVIVTSFVGRFGDK